MNLTGPLSYELDTFWGILVCIPLVLLKVQGKKLKRAYKARINKEGL